MTYASRLLPRILFRLARSSLARRAGWVFAHMTFALPLQRLRETPTLVAFHHPRPSHPVHILIAPRKAIGSLADLTSADQPLLADVVQAVQSLAAGHRLEAAGYRLVVNGGAYQDIPQLHFHLISGAPG